MLPKLTNYSIFCFILLLALSNSGCNAIKRVSDPGGIEIKAEFKDADAEDKVSPETIVKILQSRLNAAGVDGEVAITEGAPGQQNQITVKMFGSRYKDAEFLARLKELLFNTAGLLELKEVVSESSPAPARQYGTEAEAKAAATNEQEVLPYPDGYSNRQQFVIVAKKAIVTGKDLRDASSWPDPSGRDSYRISFSLNRDGAARFGDWTERSINKYLAVVLNKKVVSVAYIKSRIEDSGEITGRFTKASAEDIVIALKSGHLPVTFKILEEKTF